MSRMLYPGKPPSKSIASGTGSSPISAKAGEGASGIQNEQPRFEVPQDVVNFVLYEGVMFRVVWCRLPAILSLLVLSFTVDVTTQSSRAEELQAGITRSEVTLDFRSVAVSVQALRWGERRSEPSCQRKLVRPASLSASHGSMSTRRSRLAL